MFTLSEPSLICVRSCCIRVDPTDFDACPPAGRLVVVGVLFVFWVLIVLLSVLLDWVLTSSSLWSAVKLMALKLLCGFEFGVCLLIFVFLYGLRMGGASWR